MGEVIMKTNIPREADCIYYCKGNPISVCKAKMARGGKKKQ